MPETGTWKLKTGLAEMLKGGVIMDVTDASQAKIAQDAGAVAVMALERVPADIRAQGGVARMASVKKIKEIQESVTIPVMAKVRIGHFVEAQILQALGVDFIDESEVLTPADESHHIAKLHFKVPFVCGARDLGEALRRIGEGAALIRTKGEAGSGNIVEAVRHMRSVTAEMRRIADATGRRADGDREEPRRALRSRAPRVRDHGKLPVPNFALRHRHRRRRAHDGRAPSPCSSARGSSSPRIPPAAPRRWCWPRPTSRGSELLAEVSADLGEPMAGLEIKKIEESAQTRMVTGSRPRVVIRARCTSTRTGRAFASLAEPVLVKRPVDLEDIQGLVMPGRREYSPHQAPRQLGPLDRDPEAAGARHPHLRTCAGAILLAREVENPPQQSLGLLDVTVRRNAYGRQVDSFEADAASAAFGDAPVPVVCIRAPRFVRLGTGRRDLLEHQGEPILVRGGTVWAATFHPELTEDRRIQEAFAATMPLASHV
ncbi:MAG: pyridoxal 5'-phosphate synthase glutaminase subunit PdxT [Acidobacteriota bacterium]